MIIVCAKCITKGLVYIYICLYIQKAERERKTISCYDRKDCSASVTEAVYLDVPVYINEVYVYENK